MGGRRLILRVLITLAGLMLCGIGVGLFLYGDLGVDPASVLMMGLGKVFRISYGTASALLNIILLLIILAVDRSYINIASLLAIFGIGFMANLTRAVLGHVLPGGEPVTARLMLLAAGIFIMAAGIAVYIRANLGVGAIDLVAEIVSDKFRLPYRIARVAGDIAFVVAGWQLGGTFGIGTIAAAVLLGPAVHLVRPGINRLVDEILCPNSQ